MRSVWHFGIFGGAYKVVFFVGGCFAYGALGGHTFVIWIGALASLRGFWREWDSSELMNHEDDWGRLGMKGTWL